VIIANSMLDVRPSLCVSELEKLKVRFAFVGRCCSSCVPQLGIMDSVM